WREPGDDRRLALPGRGRATAQAGVAAMWQHRRLVRDAETDNGRNLLRAGWQDRTERGRAKTATPILGKAREILLASQHGLVAQQLLERLDQCHRQPPGRADAGPSGFRENNRNTINSIALC